MKTSAGGLSWAVTVHPGLCFDRFGYAQDCVIVRVGGVPIGAWDERGRQLPSADAFEVGGDE